MDSKVQENSSQSSSIQWTSRWRHLQVLVQSKRIKVCFYRWIIIMIIKLVVIRTLSASTTMSLQLLLAIQVMAKKKEKAKWKKASTRILMIVTSQDCRVKYMVKHSKPHPRQDSIGQPCSREQSKMAEIKCLATNSPSWMPSHPTL